MTIVLTQGLMLLMDGHYFDGRLLHHHIAHQSWPVLREWFGQAGLMGFYEFYRGVGSFPDIVLAYRLAAFLCIGLCSVLVYLIGVRSRFLSHDESLCAALIQLLFPAFRANFSLIVLPYLVAYVLFLLGAYLAVRSYGGVGWRRHAGRVAALLLLFCSYTTNSLLLLHYGFVLLMILMIRRDEHLSLFAAAGRYVFRYADLLLLPVVFWIVKETFFPRHGWYAGYNKIAFAPRTFAVNAIAFTKNAIFLQTADALRTLFTLPVFWLIVLAVALFAWSRTRFARNRTFDSPTPPVGIVFFGAVLLFLGITPYVLVFKIAQVYGFSTRLAILVPLGVGVVLVGLIKGLFRTADGRINRAGVILLATLLLAFTVSRLETVTHWQARWVKDRSVELHLREMPPYPASTYFIDEQFPVAPEVAAQRYFVYDWSCIFESVWGGESRAGLALGTDVDAWWAGDADHPMFAKIRNLSHYDPNGARARLIIRPGPEAGGLRMVLRYWWYRYISRDGLDGFLREVTRVSIEMETEKTGRTGDS